MQTNFNTPSLTPGVFEGEQRLYLQSVSLCLWNKCLFSLPFVGPDYKSHFWTKATNQDTWDGQLGNLMGKREYSTPNPL